MQYQTIPYRTGEIVVLADLHFDTYRRFSLVPSDVWGLQDMVWNADALILAGDLTNGPADRWAQVFQYLSEFIPPGRIYAFPGNHDYYSGHLSDDPALAKVTDDAGAHFVQKQALLHGDTRILCCTLWTDFNLSGAQSIAMRDADLLMADYDRIGAPLPYGIPASEVPIMRRDRRLKPRETLRVHLDHRAWLEEKLADQHPCGDQGRTVIVTHHGPHRAVAGYIDALSAAFHSDMSDLIVRHRPDAWFFGHSHRRLRAKVLGTDIRNVSVGYAGELIDESISYLREACLWKS
ncbi:metallophosphoesterase [Yoonia maritima]|uniref:metallophosphoesterase n=1 Tax=Yoonia maritima TaxID=1435347 RepID=UPI000D0FCC57|nr:metallophosphoesterase [Yoonia maritima]